MSAPSLAAFAPQTSVSPLMLADQLLTLAQNAERAGYRRPAERLLKLAYAVYEEKPSRG
jgi:hypothetical protein